MPKTPVQPKKELISTVQVTETYTVSLWAPIIGPGILHTI